MLYKSIYLSTFYLISAKTISYCESTCIKLFWYAIENFESLLGDLSHMRKQSLDLAPKIVLYDFG